MGTQVLDDAGTSQPRLVDGEREEHRVQPRVQRAGGAGGAQRVDEPARDHRPGVVGQRAELAQVAVDAHEPHLTRVAGHRRRCAALQVARELDQLGVLAGEPHALVAGKVAEHVEGVDLVQRVVRPQPGVRMPATLQGERDPVRGQRNRCRRPLGPAEPRPQHLDPCAHLLSVSFVRDVVQHLIGALRRIRRLLLEPGREEQQCDLEPGLRIRGHGHLTARHRVHGRRGVVRAEAVVDRAAEVLDRRVLEHEAEVVAGEQLPRRDGHGFAQRRDREADVGDRAQPGRVLQGLGERTGPAGFAGAGQHPAVEGDDRRVEVGVRVEHAEEVLVDLAAVQRGVLDDRDVLDLGQPRLRRRDDVVDLVALAQPFVHLGEPPDTLALDVLGRASVRPGPRDDAHRGLRHRLADPRTQLLLADADATANQDTPPADSSRGPRPDHER